MVSGWCWRQMRPPVSDTVYTIGRVTGTDSTGSPAVLQVKAQGDRIIFSTDGHEVFLDADAFDEMDAQMSKFEQSDEGVAWLTELAGLENSAP